mmetsp:Transcript_21169/g.38204  ORF Transcript_21169/g.38204 Transcript_21169/m.38204 type:complete len:249 (-) Transcript_21169:261-1007(-)|eukprot:CAMPEP_0198293208 /NCGR_PEP_ID=MMETSP1449-20131203/16050_1 /TAXON_ID=420275 /ORGANISM="Attheya septentrionalis, Strain CCMP2084" /LENGTH=248 /DNA_ID=CAMNT_0043992721 /DNA_START=125 /DNA_END=871 /DNA_ORIENTATION=-
MDDDSRYEDALRRMAKLVNNLMSRGDCGPFREPVDWRDLGLWDYPKVIKKMMDLGTVKRKLERTKYTTAAECAEDIRLIWDNCKTYNADGSDFYLLADSFSRRFEDRYRKIQAEYDTGEDDVGSSGKGGSSATVGSPTTGSTVTTSKSGGAPSLESKTRFGANLFRLSGTELGHLMQVIDLKCPQALEQPGGGAVGDVEINVDLMDSRTFTELDRYVRDKVGAKQPSETDENDENQDSSASGDKKRKR